MEQIAEIEVKYRTKVKASERPRISNSSDVYTIFKDIWNHDLIEYQEQFYLLLVNKANAVIGYKLISTGGICGTVVDVKQLLAIALKCNASGIILGHNLPSGNLQPSQADIDLTRKIKSGYTILELALLDHLIVTPDGVY